jgi:uncharacterized membrane protein
LQAAEDLAPPCAVTSQDVKTRVSRLWLRWTIRLSSDPAAPGLPRLKVRIEALSDLVFGLALSLGSIVLVQRLPQSSADLMGDVFQFGFSFLIIVGIWLGYTRIIGILPVETSVTLVLNLGLLFCVALEPFLLYTQFQTSDLAFQDFSTAAFALDTGAMMGLLSGMMLMVLREERLSVAHRLRPSAVRNFRISMIAQAIGAALFLVSVSDVFWVEVPGLGNLRFLLWYGALGTFFASRAFARKGVEGTPTPRH